MKKRSIITIGLASVMLLTFIALFIASHHKKYQSPNPDIRTGYACGIIISVFILGGAIYMNNGYKQSKKNDKLWDKFIEHPNFKFASDYDFQCYIHEVTDDTDEDSTDRERFLRAFGTFCSQENLEVVIEYCNEKELLSAGEFEVLRTYYKKNFKVMAQYFLKNIRSLKGAIFDVNDFATGIDRYFVIQGFDSPVADIGDAIVMMASFYNLDTSDEDLVRFIRELLDAMHDQPNTSPEHRADIITYIYNYYF